MQSIFCIRFWEIWYSRKAFSEIEFFCHAGDRQYYHGSLSEFPVHVDESEDHSYPAVSDPGHGRSYSQRSSHLNSEHWETRFLLIQSQFYDEVEIDGYFILVPDIESYPKILKSLGIPVA